MNWFSGEKIYTYVFKYDPEAAPVREREGEKRRESVQKWESTLRRPNFDCDLQKSMLKKLHETHT